MFRQVAFTIGVVFTCGLLRPAGDDVDALTGDSVDQIRERNRQMLVADLEFARRRGYLPFDTASGEALQVEDAPTLHS